MNDYKVGQIVSVKLDPCFRVEGVVLSEAKNGKIGVDVGFGDEYKVPVKNVELA